MNQRELGRAMKRAREDAGLEQKDAAGQLGVHYMTLSRYERGERPAPLALREQMATLYRVTRNTLGLPDEQKSGSGGLVSTSLPAVPAFDTSVTVAIPRDQLFYWRGRLDSDLRSLNSARETLEAVTQSLHTLGGMFEKATAGVAAFMDSNVLPGPRPPTPEERMDEIDRAVDEEKRRAQTGKPPRRRAAGA